MAGGGFPYERLHAELRAMGLVVPVPPSADASRLDVLQDYWAGAGLTAVETRVITVQRTFASFEDYWTTILGAPSAGATLARMSPANLAQLQARLRPLLLTDAAGRIKYSATANAVKGRIPH